MDIVCGLAAADAQARQRNWIADQYNASPVNSPNFVADQGYAGDGSSSYLDSGTLQNWLAHYAQDSASMFIWILTNSANANEIDIGTSTSLSLLRSRYVSDQALARVNQSSSVAISGVTDSFGLWLLSRAAANAVKVYRTAF